MSNKPISSQDTPDPWIIPHNNKFYLTFTLGNRIEVWRSNCLENFHSSQKSIIWQPAANSPWSSDIWAPELHYLKGTWYIYSCAAQPGQGNPSHRTIVLRSSSQDPMDAHAWTFLGPMRGLPDHWHIDATVFSLNGSNDFYCCYSGWPIGDHSDTQQDLFLIKLASPEQAIAETLVCISRASLPWERPEGGRRGVNEGPTWLSLPGWQGIVYSANGSWTCDYQMGMLQYTGGDPMKESSWRKKPIPLLKSDHAYGGPFGPGHASFVHSPYGDGSVYCIYHATERADEGWNNRKARVLCLGSHLFHEQAEPMCCATNVMSNAGRGSAQGQVVQHGFPGSGYQPSTMGRRAESKSFLEKLGDKAMKKMKEF